MNVHFVEVSGHNFESSRACCCGFVWISQTLWKGVFFLASFPPFSFTHSWASAFRRPVSQSVTGLGSLIPVQVPNCFGIGISVHSGTVLTGCRTVRHLKKGPCTSILLVLGLVKGIPMQWTSKLQEVKSSKVKHLARP
jgi:hypothetical protein